MELSGEITFVSLNMFPRPRAVEKCQSFGQFVEVSVWGTVIYSVERLQRYIPNRFTPLQTYNIYTLHDNLLYCPIAMHSMQCKQYSASVLMHQLHTKEYIIKINKSDLKVIHYYY